MFTIRDSVFDGNDVGAWFTFDSDSGDPFIATVDLNGNTFTDSGVALFTDPPRQLFDAAGNLIPSPLTATDNTFRDNDTDAAGSPDFIGDLIRDNAGVDTTFFVDSLFDVYRELQIDNLGAGAAADLGTVPAATRDDLVGGGLTPDPTPILDLISPCNDPAAASTCEPLVFVGHSLMRGISTPTTPTSRTLPST